MACFQYRQAVAASVSWAGRARALESLRVCTRGGHTSDSIVMTKAIADKRKKNMATSAKVTTVHDWYIQLEDLTKAYLKWHFEEAETNT